jgi:enoyl-CoA hydratase/carnithine racemase
MTAHGPLHIARPIPGVTLVEIDNPPANALTEELYAALSDTVTELELDDDTRVVVIASAHERIFVSGADIGAMANYDFRRGAIARKVDLVGSCFLRLQRLGKPTIAAIEGHAVGGGCELALAMDFRFMARGPARIGLTEAALGIIPGGGGTQRLSRLLGRARATEMLMLAERLDADAAERVGLITAACDANAVRDRAFAHAERLAAMPRSSLRLIKRALNDGYDGDLVNGLAVEREATIEALLSPEAQEGITAFLEKRPAAFD